MPAVGDIFQYTFIQQLQLQILETVIHFRAKTLLPLVEVDHFNVATSFLVELQKSQTTSCTYPSVRVKQMTPLAFDQIIFTPGQNSGLINETPQNNQISLIFTKRTGVAGSTHRGRMYVGGFPLGWGLNFLLNGAPAAAALSTANGLLAKFSETGTDPTMVAGIYSKAIGGSTPFTVAGWQPITKWEPQITFGVQRKRRIGVGI
jgi:hypothetical protein